MLNFDVPRLKALRSAMVERLDLVQKHVAKAEKFTANLGSYAAADISFFFFLSVSLCLFL